MSTSKTYTLSAYINTADVTKFAGSGIYLVAVDSSGNTFQSNYLNYNTSSDVDWGWVRLSLTFTPKTGSVHTIGIFNQGAEGIFYADDVQLEVGEAPSSLNLVTNGSMSVSGGWAWLNGCSYASITDRAGNSTRTMMVEGDPEDGNTKFYQDIPINRPGKETYVLSGWVKANAAPDNVQTASDEAMDANKQCGLRAVVYYSDDSSEFHYVPFNANLSGWQYTSMAIVPKKPDLTVTTIRITGTYEKNVNIAYFDDIALVQEVAQVMDYDEKGNLISVASTGTTVQTREYDNSNNNLIKLVTGGNGTYTYTYEASGYPHRVTAASIEDVLTQSYTYDAVGNVTATALRQYEDTSSTTALKTSASYTNSGNLLSSMTDVNGITTNYDYANNYSKIFGVPSTTTDAGSTATTQTVDALGRITNTAVANLNQVVYTYLNGRLNGIERTANSVTQSYLFSYDSFSNITSISVRNQYLATYTYGPRNGPLSKLTYGNGDTVSYTYDALGRTKTVTQDNGTVLTYAYTGEGRLHSITETNGTSTVLYLYIYDSIGRLVTSQKIDNGTSTLRTHQEYNTNNQLTKQTWTAGSTTHTEEYSYNSSDGTLNSITGNHGQALTLGYDALRRVNLRTTTHNGTAVLTDSLSYRSQTDSTTMQVSSRVVDVGDDYIVYYYTYDALGNIASIREIHTYDVPRTSLNYTCTYEYDAQSQLIRENNEAAYKTWVWTYDNAGNIKSCKEYEYTTKDTDSLGTPLSTVSYGYTNTNWRDLLTSYGGKSITYDNSGNPLSDGTWTYTWENGRQLASMTNGTTTWSYTYQADGLRTKRTSGGTTYKYIYGGDKLLRMTVGSNTLDFTYDASGSPLSVVFNGTVYYYVTNLQGDVVKILDSSGATVMGYSYDAWGNPISQDGFLADTLGLYNPLRYRGYIYDPETGLYFLQSRYYNPEMGRFINADYQLSTGSDLSGLNLFAYCGNNPISREDPNGDSFETVWDAISFAGSVVEVATNPYDPWAWIGLAGDTADLLIPFIGGIGETTRALKAASQAAELIDAASDAKKGWKIGEDITSLTRAGNVPSWSTLRSRYWKNKAYFFATEYSEENVSRMMRGLAPQFFENGKQYTMELHHILGREGNNFYFFFEITPEGHAQVDPFRFIK